MNPRSESDITRQQILEAGYKEIQLKGFRAARVDDLIGNTAFTKGAFYYHFPNKIELGYAVVDEVVASMIGEYWKPIAEAENPIEAGVGILQRYRDMVAENPAIVITGCPLNNLMLEMSPIDEEFRKRLNDILIRWRGWIADGLANGQNKGYVRPDVDPLEEATFILATFEGATSLAKNAQSTEMFNLCLTRLAKHFRSLTV